MPTAARIRTTTMVVALQPTPTLSSGAPSPGISASGVVSMSPPP
jgi:hypothetical protein